MTKKTPKGSGCPGCTGAGAHDFGPACELEWEPPPKPAYVPPERGCMGGPLGGGWCGRPAEVVAIAEDGGQWFACLIHRAGSKTVVAIEDWFKANVDPDSPIRGQELEAEQARLRQMLDNPPPVFAREYQGTPYRLQPEYPCQHIRWDGSPCRETATVVVRNDLSQVDRHLCEEHAGPKFLRSGDRPEPRPEPTYELVTMADGRVGRARKPRPEPAYETVMDNRVRPSHMMDGNHMVSPEPRPRPEYQCIHTLANGFPCRKPVTHQHGRAFFCEEHAQPEPPPLHITCVACPDPATGFDDLRGAFTCDRCRAMGKVKP